MKRMMSVLQRAVSLMCGRIVFASLVVAPLLVAITMQNHVAKTEAAPVLPQINAVYLTDSARPALSRSTVQSFGIRTVSSAADLEKQAANADVVIIDSSLFPQVHQVWLGTQIKQGRAVAALNVPIGKLEALPAFNHTKITGRFPNDFQGKSFFSIVWQRQVQVNGHTETHGGELTDTLSDPAVFLSHVRFAAQKS